LVNISDYGALQYTQMLVGLVSPPTSMYIALCTSEPQPGGLASDLIEPVDATGYMRKNILTAGWSLVSSDIAAIVNNGSFSWTPTDADWLPVSWVALCTSVGTNQVWMWDDIDTFTGIIGSTVSIDVAALTLSVSGPAQVVTA
jgi:hypothetical protein